MRAFFAFQLLLLYGIFCYWCLARYRRTHSTLAAPAALNESWLIGYASQTGIAEHLARQTAVQLQKAGVSTWVQSLNQLDVSHLSEARHLLFVVSTYGEGEAPDNGNRFLSRLANQSLDGTSYALLALGDSNYPRFCEFGRQLNHALHHAGARPLFDLVEVDQRDPGAIRHWQYYLGQLTACRDFTDWLEASYENWQLVNRICLNPQGYGNPAFHLQLRPLDKSLSAIQWQAGDIAEIGPANAAAVLDDFLSHLGHDSSLLRTGLLRKRLPVYSAVADAEDLFAAWRLMSDQELLDQLQDLPHREYSIASTPAQGALELLVRQQGRLDKDAPYLGLGLGSGWLTHHAQTGASIALRIRSNPHFHGSELDRPMILIGNGTGIAGLRAHLLARIAAGTGDNWLLFGERSRKTDFFFGEELLGWQASGHLARLDLAFSRDADAPRYVQELLPPAAEELRTWVDRGAAIYVCGSLKGMAQGVNEVLEAIFGREKLEALADERRYCRDVY